MYSSKRILLTFCGVLALFVFIGFVLITTFSKNSGGARDASEQFAAAVIKGDPALAPKGARDYVRGVEQRFGAISSARVIDVRNTHHGRGNNSTSYYVGDVLLNTASGPAVVELEFNNAFIVWGTGTVTDVEELAPVDVPDRALDDAGFVALAKAFEARGGASSDLAGTDDVAVAEATPEATPTKREKAEKRAADKQLRTAMKQMECVKKANGDIEKLTRCAG